MDEDDQRMINNFNAGLAGFVGYMDRRNHFAPDDPRPPVNYAAGTTTIRSDMLEKKDAVSTLYRCETVNAKNLYIYDIAYKLQTSENYDIGGTYCDKKPCLWFYFTTTQSAGHNYLLNLFVCHREPGTFSIGISKVSQPLSKTYLKDDSLVNTPEELVWYNFKSEQADEHHFIKTFNFSKKDVEFLYNCILTIPIVIEINPKSILHQDVLRRIKLQSEFGNNLLKDMKTDYTLISPTGKEYNVHKILVAAHSPVLREMMKNDKGNTMKLDFRDDEIEMLVQFLYTGMIKDILNQKYDALLAMSHKLQLKNMSVLVRYVIDNDINTDNAVSIAIISEEYKLDNIQEVAFKYIKAHPEVLESEAWAQVESATLVKKLLKYIHMKE